MKEKLKQIMADILELDVAEISDNASQKNIPQWDSLQHLNLIVEIEEAFEVSFEPEQIGEMTTLDKIIDVLTLMKS